MDPSWDIFFWSAIPVAVLLLACAASAYWLPRRRPRPLENAQERVERAYRGAKSQPAGGGRCQPGHVFAVHGWPGGQSARGQERAVAAANRNSMRGRRSQGGRCWLESALTRFAIFGEGVSSTREPKCSVPSGKRRRSAVTMAARQDEAPWTSSCLVRAGRRASARGLVRR